LEWNLYGATEPRVGLNARGGPGFNVYEQPGELSGSALLSHPAAIAPYAERLVPQAIDERLVYVEFRGSPQKYGDGLEFLRAFHSAVGRALQARGRKVDVPDVVDLDCTTVVRFIKHGLTTTPQRAS
jgi:adenosine deaminase